jgi:hypothetical protein
MSLVNITFIPLYPGESPGDPELGGWRSLPKHLFKHRLQSILSLEEVVRLTTFRLHEFQLRQAIGIVVQHLAS